MKITPQLLALIVTISSAIGAGIPTIIFKSFDKTLDSLFDRWKFRKADKKQWADEIIKIYTEGAIYSWSIEPRSYEHINWVANQIEGIDSEVASTLRNIAGRWNILAFMQNPDRNGGKAFFSLEDTNYFQKEQADLNELGNKLLKTAHKWKK